jgi:hypothetical protein
VGDGLGADGGQLKYQRCDHLFGGVGADTRTVTLTTSALVTRQLPPHGQQRDGSSGAAGKELPRLRLLSSPANSVSLYWQRASSNYGLESRSNLTSAAWLPVSQSRTQSGAAWKVIAPMQPAQEFFRLRKP